MTVKKTQEPGENTDKKTTPKTQVKKPAAGGSRLSVKSRRKAMDTTEKALSEVAITDVQGVPKNVELQRTNLVLTKAEYLKVKTYALKTGQDLQDLLYKKNHGWINELPD